LVLRMPSAIAPAANVLQAGQMAAGVAPSASESRLNGEATKPAGLAVLAPLTGLYYKSPSPGAEPFVREGGEVHVGQVIGLIEAMKLFNEIKSDVAGRVVRICVDDGGLVKAKQPLIELSPL
jgi:acetyl-CoA carboxylase biotin carboxyl carrier protein